MYSIFRGENWRGATATSADEGRLILLERPQEIHTKIQLTGGTGHVPDSRNRPALQCIVANIVQALAAKDRGNST